MKSRFIIMHLAPQQDDWAKWAIGAGIHPVCIAFSNFKPQFITDITISPDIENTHCPRTLTNMFRIWMTQDYPKSVEYAYLGGAAGSLAASEFLAFVRIWQHLPNVEQILKDPTGFQAPTKPDILFALSGALAAKATKKNAANFFSVVSKLGRDFSVLAVRDALRRDSGLMEVDQFTEWVVAHQDVVL